MNIVAKIKDGVVGAQLTLGGSGTGILTLSGANTYTGATTINSGTLRLGASNVIPDGSAVSIANVSSAVFNVNGNSDTIASLSGGGSTGGNVQLGTGTLTVGDSSSTTFGGVISGTSGKIVKQGAGILALTGSNTYTGTTTISAGSLQLGNGGTTGALSTSSAITNNGDLSINRSNAVAQGTDFSGSAISGIGTLTQAGSGTTTLNAANTYSGGTKLNAGTLSLGSSGAIGSMGTISFNGGTLQSTASNTSDYSARFSTAANQQYKLDTNNQSVTLATGLTSSGGTLTKTGSGVLTLSGANTYTGLTSVTGGTLLVDGSLANGGVEVYGGATLGGKGTIGVGGGSTVKIGATGTGSGTFSPGASIAVENIVGNLTFGSNGNFAYEINSSVSFASGADLVNVSGDISIDPAANLNFSDLATTPVLLDGSGAKYTLLSYAGTLTGTFASKPNNSIVTIGSSSFYLRYNDTSPGQNFSGSTLYSKYVTITAVPEASAFLFGTVASVLAGGVYLRRKAVGSRIRTAN